MFSPTGKIIKLVSLEGNKTPNSPFMIKIRKYRKEFEFERHVYHKTSGSGVFETLIDQENSFKVWDFKKLKITWHC